MLLLAVRGHSSVCGVVCLSCDRKFIHLRMSGQYLSVLLAELRLYLLHHTWEQRDTAKQPYCCHISVPCILRLAPERVSKTCLLLLIFGSVEVRSYS